MTKPNLTLKAYTGASMYYIEYHAPERYFQIKSGDVVVAIIPLRASERLTFRNLNHLDRFDFIGA